MIEEFETWAISAGFDVEKIGHAYRNEKTSAALAGFAVGFQQRKDFAELILAVMGPTTPPCCDGCETEWNEVLRAAQEIAKTPNAPHEGADAALSRTLPLDAVVGGAVLSAPTI